MFPPARWVSVSALALLLATTVAHPARGAAQPTAPAGAPKLVVILVADQMRADYLERYSGRFTGGLRRLMQNGAWFQRAAYPYLNTITCAGHSTIGTGTFPYQHGMILNAWFDRKTGTSTECTVDSKAREVSYNGLVGAGDSGWRILKPTLADRVREQQHGRVVTMSLKARSAIGLAGHAGDVVLWFDTRGGWTTSSDGWPAGASAGAKASALLLSLLLFFLVYRLIPDAPVRTVSRITPGSIDCSNASSLLPVPVNSIV